MKTSGTKHYITCVQYDEKLDDMFIELPPEMLEELGWTVGTDVEWVDNKDGTFTLKKRSI